VIGTSSLTDQVVAALAAELRSFSLLRETLPMLSTWGVPDYSTTIHSLLINYLTALGRAAGFWAVSEYPILPSGQVRVNRDIRCDLAWFAPPAGQVVLLSEVERWSAGRRAPDVLRRKAENLAVAHHQVEPGPRVLLLAVWTTPSEPILGLETLRSHLRSGFSDDLGTRVPAVPAEIRIELVRLVLQPAGNGLVLREAALA
jgi:hypothetical protein